MLDDDHLRLLEDNFMVLLCLYKLSDCRNKFKWVSHCHENVFYCMITTYYTLICWMAWLVYVINNTIVFRSKCYEIITHLPEFVWIEKESDHVWYGFVGTPMSHKNKNGLENIHPLVDSLAIGHHINTWLCM